MVTDEGFDELAQCWFKLQPLVKALGQPADFKV
jgi:hypothetical protein